MPLHACCGGGLQGWFLFWWGVFSFFMTLALCNGKTNRVLQFVFWTLDLLFLLLAIAHWVEDKVRTNTHARTCPLAFCMSCLIASAGRCKHPQVPPISRALLRLPLRAFVPLSVPASQDTAEVFQKIAGRPRWCIRVPLAR